VTSKETQHLAKSWIEAEDKEHSERKESEWQTIFEVQDLAYSAPEILWSFVLSVLEQNPTSNVLGMLSAGPLEDLIQDHGEQFLERISTETRLNPAFAALLPKVWIPDAPDAITKKYISLGCDVVQLSNKPSKS
jgi:hypothetical protein